MSELAETFSMNKNQKVILDNFAKLYILRFLKCLMRDFQISGINLNR